MPYISKTDREELENGDLPVNAGELNYLISTLVDDFMLEHGKSYSVMNEIVGALECAKLEMYRRICAPYEDEKIEAIDAGLSRQVQRPIAERMQHRAQTERSLAQVSRCPLDTYRWCRPWFERCRN